MAARAEVARLAGEGEQQVGAAAAAADAREAAVQVAAFEKALEHVLRAARRTRPEARNSERCRLTHCQSGLARGPARAIDRRAIGLHPPSNARPIAVDVH